MNIQSLPLRQIIKNHRVFFIDLYGVLKTESGHIAGVEKTIAEIQE